MTDTFDALREADANRKEWAKAAMAFQCLLDHLNDPESVKHWRRIWSAHLEKPLAPASEAWDIVLGVRDDVVEDYPITLTEAHRADVPLDVVWHEGRRWQDASLERQERVEKEVGLLLDADVDQLKNIVTQSKGT